MGLFGGSGGGFGFNWAGLGGGAPSLDPDIVGGGGGDGGDISEMFGIFSDELLEEFAEELGEQAMDIVFDMLGGGTVGQQTIMDEYIDGWLQDYIYFDVLDKNVSTYEDWEGNWVAIMGEEKYSAVNETMDEVYDEIYGVLVRVEEIRDAMRIVRGVLAFMNWAMAGAGGPD